MPKAIGKYFLNGTPIAQEIRTHKCDWIKLKNFCTSKETRTRMMRETTKWKKISSSYSSDKELISKIYKEVKKIKIKRSNRAGGVAQVVRAPV
jgi:hypothetical protein